MWTEVREKFYLSAEGALEKACQISGLSKDEIEGSVRRFRSGSRKGKLRGECVRYWDGTAKIRHHWEHQRVYWRGEDELHGNENLDHEQNGSGSFCDERL
jgi:hypothetical protein